VVVGVVLEMVAPQIHRVEVAVLVVTEQTLLLLHLLLRQNFLVAVVLWSLLLLLPLELLIQ
jgi:hypothetical protein